MGRLRSAVVEITNRCNLRCVHCASSSGMARPGELSLEEIMSLAGDLRALGCESVTLLGGEIFLRRGWEEVALRIRDLGMELTVVTNGLLVDGAVADTLASIEPGVVGVSVDGATRDSYRAARGADGFEASMRAIALLQAAGLPEVNAITCFHRGNIGDFERFVDLFAGTAVNWQVQIAGKGGDRFPDDLFLTADDYRTLVSGILEAKASRRDLRLSTMDDIGYFPLLPAPASIAEWDGCQAGISAIGIRSNGEVLPCLSLGDAFVVASTRRAPLASIWADDAAFEPFRHKERHLAGACAECDVRGRCRGGCTEIARSATGGIGEDPYCLRAIERARLTALIAGDAGRET